MRKKIAAADQHGIFQNFQVGNTDYATRERWLSMRGGERSSKRDTDSLYNLSDNNETSRVPTEYVAPHLSTRYSPDHIGHQVLRIGDGVYQDPITNKIYDYNEGFKTEDGRDFPGGSAALQSSLMRMANKFDDKGLFKKADEVDAIIKKFNSKDSFVNNKEKNIFLKEASMSIANDLDQAGLISEADILDGIIKVSFDRTTYSKLDIAKLATELDESGFSDIADILDSWASRP